jgi:predicted nucleic acid-binding protein
MKLIADASVIAKWLFRETGYEPSERLMKAWADGRITLHAPEILAAEVASSIWKRVAREKMSEPDAQHLYRWFQKYCPILVPLSSLTEPAFELAVRHRQTIYDCLYIALAMETRTAFLTADEKLCRAFQPLTSLVRPLETFGRPGYPPGISI